MKIYCMSDIHGCYSALCDALELVIDHLDEPDTKLIFLGDYIHGGEDNIAVLKKIMGLQNIYGHRKVVALLGNHEEMAMSGFSLVNEMLGSGEYDDSDDSYRYWFERLPRYHVEGNTIFVHAGIDEDSGNAWEYCTEDYIFTEQYPHRLGKIHGLDKKVVAGHVHTNTISGDRRFNDIYYDGASHYYIDGDVLSTGDINVLMVDTDTDKYYICQGNEIFIIMSHYRYFCSLHFHTFSHTPIPACKHTFFLIIIYHHHDYFKNFCSIFYCKTESFVVYYYT